MFLFLVNFHLVLFSVFTTLSLLEISGVLEEYAFEAESDQAIHRPDSSLVYSLIPNGHSETNAENFNEVVDINSFGVRGDDILTNTKTRRVIISGDSMVFGHGVNNDETFPYQLSRKLKEKNKRMRL